MPELVKTIIFITLAVIFVLILVLAVRHLANNQEHRKMAEEFLTDYYNKMIWSGVLKILTIGYLGNLVMAKRSIIERYANNFMTISMANLKGILITVVCLSLPVGMAYLLTTRMHDFRVDRKLRNRFEFVL